jgi:hypothetical protein
VLKTSPNSSGPATFFPVYLQDYITGLYPSQAERPLCLNEDDLDSVCLAHSKRTRRFWRKILNRQAEVSALDFSALNQLLGYAERHTAGDGKTDSLKPPWFGHNGCIHSYHLACEAEKRPPAIAGICGCVCLNRL